MAEVNQVIPVIYHAPNEDENLQLPDPILGIVFQFLEMVADNNTPNYIKRAITNATKKRNNDIIEKINHFVKAFGLLLEQSKSQVSSKYLSYFERKIKNFQEDMRKLIDKQIFLKFIKSRKDFDEKASGIFMYLKELIHECLCLSSESDEGMKKIDDIFNIISLLPEPIQDHLLVNMVTNFFSKSRELMNNPLLGNGIKDESLKTRFFLMLDSFHWGMYSSQITDRFIKSNLVFQRIYNCHYYNDESRFKLFFRNVPLIPYIEIRNQAAELAIKQFVDKKRIDLAKRFVPFLTYPISPELEAIITQFPKNESRCLIQ